MERMTLQHTGSSITVVRGYPERVCAAAGTVGSPDRMTHLRARDRPSTPSLIVVA